MGFFVVVKRDFLLLCKLGSEVIGLHPVGASKLGCWYITKTDSSSVLPTVAVTISPLVLVCHLQESEF